MLMAESDLLLNTYYLNISPVLMKKTHKKSYEEKPFSKTLWRKTRFGIRYEEKHVS